MRLGYQARINIALAAGLLLLLLLAFGFHSTVRSFLEDAAQERASHESMLRLQETASHLRAAESAQRKYLISGSPADLAEYLRTRASVVQAFALARQHDATETLRMLDELKEVVLPRLHRMDYAIRLRQERGLAAASEVVLSDLSREQRQNIERIFQDIRTAESRALQASRQETEDGARRTWWLSLVSGALSALLLGWAIFLANRHHRRRQAAEAGLAASLDEVKRVSAALRSSESQLRQVVDSVPVLIMYVAADGQVLFHNRAYVECLGLPQPPAAAAYALERPHLERALRGEVVSWERESAAGGVVRTYEMKYIPRHGEAGTGDILGVYVVGTDVTEFRRMDRLKSEFVATVSHELRTPLTSIRASLGLVAGGVAGSLPDKARDLVQIAKSNCERLARLIDDILDIEKIESGPARLALRATPLPPLLRAAVAANEAYAGQHQVRIVLQPPPQELVALVDPDRFVQVMGNLLSNAAKFSPPHASIAVRLLAEDGRARIEVRDHGPGIPPEFEARIFQKFSQADGSDTRQKGGTGLGLNIARALAQQMDGHIGFRNEAQGGCTFFFLLPLAQTSPAAGGDARPLIATP